jgi:hypothetical protein
MYESHSTHQDDIFLHAKRALCVPKVLKELATVMRLRHDGLEGKYYGRANLRRTVETDGTTVLRHNLLTDD